MDLYGFRPAERAAVRAGDCDAFGVPACGGVSCH